MLSLFTKDDTWFVIRIPSTQIKTKATDKTSFIFDLVQGDFIVTANTNSVRYAMDNSGDALLILNKLHQVDFAIAKAPDKCMRLDAQRLCKLVEAKHGAPKVLNTPSNSVGTNRKKSSLNIPIAERTRFKGMLADVKIEGRYPPMEHQIDAAWFKANNHKAFDLSTMRTGKTGSTMLALEYLFRTQQITRAVILAPLSCVRPVWVDALNATLTNHIAKAVIGSKSKRLKAFQGHADILCANFETLKLCPEQWREWIGDNPYCLVIDECTHYANLRSQRTKACLSMIKDTEPEFVWGLTGTPGYDPLKAFAMSKTINPNAVTCKTLYAWRDLTQYKYGPQEWQWRNRDCAPELIHKALSPAVLFKKEDIFDLPPVVYIAREVEQTLEQQRLMNRLRDDMRVCADSGDTITAQQKSALVSKLMQCACGAVYADGGTTLEINNSNRVDEIEELISEATGKTVIFSAFTGAINKLQRALTKKGIKCAVVDGNTSENARTKIFRAFQNEPKGQSTVDVLIAHPRTTAFGVELASADMMIFDGAPLSGDFVFGQAVERLSSVKQRAKQITIAQVYSCPEERKVFTALIDGQKEADIVAGLFRSVTGNA